VQIAQTSSADRRLAAIAGLVKPAGALSVVAVSEAAFAGLPEPPGSWARTSWPAKASPSACPQLRRPFPWHLFCPISNNARCRDGLSPDSRHGRQAWFFLTLSTRGASTSGAKKRPPISAQPRALRADRQLFYLRRSGRKGFAKSPSRHPKTHYLRRLLRDRVVFPGRRSTSSWSAARRTGGVEPAASTMRSSAGLPLGRFSPTGPTRMLVWRNRTDDAESGWMSLHASRWLSSAFLLSACTETTWRALTRQYYEAVSRNRESERTASCFERSLPGSRAYSLPALDVEKTPPDDMIGPELIRDGHPRFPLR